PAALDGVVDRTVLAGLRVAEAASWFEIDDQFEGLRLGIKVSGHDLPGRTQTECLGEKMLDGHGHDPRVLTGGDRSKSGRAGRLGLRKVAHKNPPLRRASSRPILASEPCGQLSSKAL